MILIKVYLWQLLNIQTHLYYLHQLEIDEWMVKVSDAVNMQQSKPSYALTSTRFEGQTKGRGINCKLEPVLSWKATLTSCATDC